MWVHSGGYRVAWGVSGGDGVMGLWVRKDHWIKWVELNEHALKPGQEIEGHHLEHYLSNP